jgi:hypothetical protein
MRLNCEKKTFGVNKIITNYNFNSFEEFFWVNLSSLKFVELKRELKFNLCMLFLHMGHNLYAKWSDMWWVSEWCSNTKGS